MEARAAWFAAIEAAPPDATMLAADVPDTRAWIADANAVDMSGLKSGGFRLTARIKTTCERGLPRFFAREPDSGLPEYLAA